MGTHAWADETPASACPHAAAVHETLRLRALHAVAWAGGFAVCACCRCHFPSIDPPPARCADCASPA